MRARVEFLDKGTNHSPEPEALLTLVDGAVVRLAGLSDGEFDTLAGQMPACLHLLTAAPAKTHPRRSTIATDRTAAAPPELAKPAQRTLF